MGADSVPILVVLIIYMVVILAVGTWLSRRVKKVADYAVAGRNLPLPFITATLFMTMFASEDLIATPGQAYWYGVQGCLYAPFSIAILGLIGAGILTMRFYRRSGFLTLADFTKSRYGNRFNVLFMSLVLLIDAGWLAALYVAFGFIVQYYFGIPFLLGLALGVAITTVYTWLSGLWGVVYTDMIQGIILVVGVLILFPLVISSSEIGGLSNLLSNAGSALVSDALTPFPTPEDGYLGYFGMAGALYFFAFAIGGGIGGVAWPDNAQRGFAARNEATAVWGAILAGILWLIIGMMPMLLGMAMFQMDPNLMDTDFIIFDLIARFIPSLTARAIVVAAMVAALMSSADTAIVTNAAIISNNIIKEIRPGISDRNLLMWTRVGGVIFTVCALAIALGSETIYKLVALACIFSSLTAPAILAGIYWKKANPAGAFASIVGSLITMLIVTIVSMPLALNVQEGFFDWAIWDAAFIGGAAGLIVATLLMIAVPLLTQKSSPPKPLVDADGKVMEHKNLLGFISFRECFQVRLKSKSQEGFSTEDLES